MRATAVGPTAGQPHQREHRQREHDDDNSARRFWDQADLRFPGTTMTIVVTGDGRAVTGLRFGPAAHHARWLDGAVRRPQELSEALEQLRCYAAGRLTRFELPTRLRGTPFQTAVWEALTRIPYGTTTTYGRLAREIGRPGSARAVGAAVGSNPIGIVVPCHRVIGSNGALTGFGGGLDNKVALLAREGITAV